MTFSLGERYLSCIVASCLPFICPSLSCNTFFLKWTLSPSFTDSSSPAIKSSRLTPPLKNEPDQLIQFLSLILISLSTEEEAKNVTSSGVTFVSRNQVSSVLFNIFLILNNKNQEDGRESETSFCYEWKDFTDCP